MSEISQAEWLSVAESSLKAEAQAILDAASRLDKNFAQAVELILRQNGKVIVSGMGKSGHVGRKIAATLCSTGTPATFLHPAEAVHGDLGIYSQGDPSILLSKSGTTIELLNLIPILRSFKSPLIAIVGNTASPLARLCDVVIDASVQSEADVYNLAPTSSSTLAMALGDALALTLMQARGFSPNDFARFHPNGQLGRNLNLRVQDVMQSGAGFPYVHPTDSMKSVMVVMTKQPLGAACVVDSEKQLLGLITDGDIRRALLEHDDIRSLCAADIMTQNPITVYPQMPVQDALNLMENRPSKISVLPVVENQICVGLIRIHDIYSS